MSRVLTYPDQSRGPRFDELLVLPNGEVGWYAWGGGAGTWESYNAGAGSLGGQVVEVSGTFVLWQGTIFLYVVGTTAEGVRFLKVMNAQDFTMVQNWTRQPPLQSQELPLSKRAAAS